ncbi:MAG: SEC-C domain-containing protein [Lachnospiraceae bacterium]|nr:SEC-C domain-containing protein [Lachnospiraceae bacterium]
MSLMNKWEELATSFNNNAQMQQKFWTNYYLQEKEIYAKLLENPEEVHEGTVQELADKFEMDLVLFGGGFLDGINDSLKEKNPVDTLEADTQVKIDIDLEKLYYNMVAAKADWLYELPQWDNLISAERRQELYKAQKRSMIIVKGKKIGRNEPCPCGSGKKYKQCCGR